MSAKFFIDTNVLLYLFDKTDLRKESIAFSLLSQGGVLSPQVLFECMNVCIKKLRRTKHQAIAAAKYLYETADFQPETKEGVENAFLILNKYMLQVFDSKIVSSALAANCSILYSEDMQNGLVIENSLTIINPFL